MNEEQLGRPTPAENKVSHFVMTERKGHEAMAWLISRSKMAGMLLSILIANIGDKNAVVASQATLGELVGSATRRGKPVHRNSIRKAIQVLEEGNFIEVVQIGGKGGALAYVINSRIAWWGRRDGIRYARFSAEVLASESEQGLPLDDRPPLRTIPQIMRDETPIPSGDHDEPPSQGVIEGTEPAVQGPPNEQTLRGQDDD